MLDLSKALGNPEEVVEDSYDWLGGFIWSGIESMPELVGIRPSTETAHWRQDHPFGAIASELAGMAIPYGGWFKATKALKNVDRIVEGLGDIDKAPFMTGALREAARFAPFEAGRVALSIPLGEEPLDSMLGSAAVNLAVGSGVGGLVRGLASAGTRSKTLKTPLPGVNIGEPIQLQLRAMRALSSDPALDPELLSRVNNRIKNFEIAARGEQVPTGTKYVEDLAEGKYLKDTLNRLFKPTTPGAVLERRMFTEASRDFPIKEGWKIEAQAAGLPDDFMDKGQFFRHLSFAKGNIKGLGDKVLALTNQLQAGKLTQEKYDEILKKLTTADAPTREAIKIDKALGSKMTSVGGNWFLAREKEGLYVMARKVQGKPGVGTADDKWVIFKTDQPGSFAQAAQNWTNLQLAKNAWVPGSQVLKDGGVPYNTARGFQENFPFNDYRVVREPGRLEKLIPQKVRGPTNETVSRLGEAAREYLAPAAFQFRKSPLANYIHSVARVAYDSAESMAQEITYGVQSADTSRSIFMQALRNRRPFQPGDDIKTILDPLTDEQLEELRFLWVNEADPEQYANMAMEGSISLETAKAASRLSQLTDGVLEDLNKTLKAMGRKPIKARRGHLGLGRSWEGAIRYPILDEAGKVQAVAGGVNRRAAQAKAQKLVEANPSWKIGEEVDITKTGGGKGILGKINASGDPIVRSPGFELERKGIKGFKWEDEKWTKDELMDTYANSIRGRLRYNANLSVEDLLSRDMDRLKAEDPATYTMLVARLNDLAGIQSQFSAWQNKIADNVLAPMLGQNSASEIVRLTNSTMWHLQLGGLKLSYPIVNAMTFMQTVIPEAVYLMSAPAEALAGRYNHFAAGGTKGPVGSMAVLSPFKLMSASVREMRKPSEELDSFFKRATNDRVIEPRIVEEYVGESATKVSDLRTAIGSPGGFGSWLKAVSEFLPAHSERLSRAHAFTTGYIVGRDHIGLQGNALYRFSRQFTENTMFLYSAADRPRIFTTPIGSSLGLFKTWMMNYMATMMEYTEGAVKYGNWSPLLWQTAGTAAVGGAAATPLYWMADGFSRAFSGESLLKNSYDMFGEEGGDAFMLGLPAALTGVSLYSNVASPASNPIRDANMLFGVATLDRLGYVGRSMGAAFDHWQTTGEHPGKSPAVRDALARAFAPVTLYRAMAAKDEGLIRSLSTGYPLIEDVPIGARVMYGLGFNPTELDRAMAVSDELYRDKTKRLSKTKALGKAFMEAQQARDSEQMSLILRQAMVWGINTESVLRSANSRTSKGQEGLLERTFRPQDIMQFESVLGR